MTNLLDGLPAATPASSWRASSWDRTGGNRDWIDVPPGAKVRLLDVDGAGCLRHLYWAVVSPSPHQYREVVCRMYWDGRDEPCVESPIGDLFGAPFAQACRLRSLAMTINPGSANRGSYRWSAGFNCYFPMPFAHGARIEIENQSDQAFGTSGGLWYQFDYERYASAEQAPPTRFHAQWRRQNTTPVAEGTPANLKLWDGTNLSDAENYHVLEATGRGHLVGLHLQIDNLAGGWYGEGDDMIFVDQEPGEWPPRLHGTGTEEIFGGGASPNTAFCGPYTGFHLVESPNYRRRVAMYRWFLADPIRFERSLRFSIEHGHANNYENDYASVAYWYQTEPHAPFPVLPGTRERTPRP